MTDTPDEKTRIGANAVTTDTFYLHTDMAERILIDHDGTTYELVERGDGIALEGVPEDDGR